MPLMCEQADALVETLKREVGYGNPTYIVAWLERSIKRIYKVSKHRHSLIVVAE